MLSNFWSQFQDPGLSFLSLLSWSPLPANTFTCMHMYTPYLRSPSFTLPLTRPLGLVFCCVWFFWFCVFFACLLFLSPNPGCLLNSSSRIHDHFRSSVWLASWLYISFFSSSPHLHVPRQFPVWLLFLFSWASKINPLRVLNKCPDFERILIPHRDCVMFWIY